MASKLIYSAEQEESLIARLWHPEMKNDPEKFVLAVFPWGQKGTPLEHIKGPRTWQLKVLRSIKEHIAENQKRLINGQKPLVYKEAISSGRGIGKSALVAWLNLWMMSTQPGATCINSANNENQLKSRTWAELGKWHTLAINSHWFDKQAMSLRPAEWFETLLKNSLKIDTGYYYAAAQLWSEEKPDGFAGIHSQIGMLLIFDEASGIPESIWKVSEGFFTDPILHRYWFAFSNPRRNTGFFFECFHRYRDFWRRRNVDSRTVEGTDTAVYDEIIKKYGDDSDEARVEVKGEFPRQGDRQFISRSIITEAVERDLQSDDYAALMMGVDPARFGDDSTVIRFRQGRNARVIPPVKLKNADNMVVANKCAELINKYNPDAVCIDAGNGTGIIDRLRERGYKVHEVWFGGKSEEEEWANKRTHLWAMMREWLNGGCIDADSDLIDDLSGPEYKFMGGSDKLRLETKEEMKSRGLASPDNADALACTFAVKVPRRDTRSSRGASRTVKQARDVDYNIF